MAESLTLLSGFWVRLKIVPRSRARRAFTYCIESRFATELSYW